MFPVPAGFAVHNRNTGSNNSEGDGHGSRVDERSTVLGLVAGVGGGSTTEADVVSAVITTSLLPPGGVNGVGAASFVSPIVRPHSFQYFVYCFVGGIAAGMVHLVVAPIDILKCRVQVGEYRSFKDGFVHLFRVEAGGSVYRALPLFFRGWLPMLWGYCIQGSIKFSLYEIVKYVLLIAFLEPSVEAKAAAAAAGGVANSLASSSAAHVSGVYQFFVFLFSSCLAEVVADLGLAPWEAVKIRMQTSPSFPVHLRSALPRMWETEGLHGFYRGLVPLWGRQVPYTMMKFSSFEFVVVGLQSLFHSLGVMDAAEPGVLGKLVVSLLAGVLAGLLCGVVSHPADTVLSKMNQRSSAPTSSAVPALANTLADATCGSVGHGRAGAAHGGAMHGVLEVMHELGWRGMWKGLAPRLLMVVSLTALQWVTYDGFKVWAGLPTSGDPRGSRWASVQPSPDRASLLLCGRHECQLLSVSSFALQVPRAAVLAQPSSSIREEDTRRSVAQQWNERGSAPGNSAVGGRGRCIVLPQPHRDLTSSCWLSAGLGDAASVVTIMRPSPLSRALSPHGTAARWLQATIFLKDEEDAVFAGGTPLTWNHQRHDHHGRLGKATALGRPCQWGRTPPLAPAWKAVEAVLPCSYVPSHSSGGQTDMHILCQRVDEVYEGSGVAAGGRSARRPCSGVWLASVQRESAWRVPLAMPPGEEDVMDSGGDGAAARSLAEARHVVRRSPRLFDVRRRMPPALQHAPPHQPSHLCPATMPAPAHQRASNAATGPMGLVFAAAFRRHVGLYTAATVTPTVFFELPSWLTGGGGTAPAAATSSPSQCSSWCVTSVVEEPSLVAPAAVPQTSNGGGSGYSYLVTAMHNERGKRRSRPYPVHAKVSHVDDCWWLLYDCRNPSRPVWVAEEALAAPPALDEDDLWHDAPVVTEWLASTSPASHASLRRSPVCATYVPLATTSAEGSSALGVLSACGVCLVLDGGATMPDGAGLDAEDDDDVEGEEAADVFAPIMYELSPPRSLLSPTLSAHREVIAKPPRVRALTFTDGVLHYACEEAL
ncbi:Mitochondrial carrier family protein [Leishmania donovani]|uniref:Mitochondrial carrier family protein n=1 Tax=Leishmania donovani TaxID=5661 RepID=A0A504Y0N8_LEIDO|nr:Mitochondrial carrier family protein [Leishmania donovani]